MIYQYEEILQNYDINIKQVMNGRNMMIFDTDKGIKALKAIRLHDCKIQYISNFQKLLAENDILVDIYRRNKEELLATEFDDKKYVLKDYYKGGEININNRQEIKQVIRLLARIHNVTRGKNKCDDHFDYDKGMGFKDTLVRHVMEMKRTRNRIRKQKTFSEFDMAFIGCYDTYFQQANSTLVKLEKVLEKLETDYNDLSVVIHGQFNYHSIIACNQKEGHVVDFEYACTHYPVIDLYSFMRKVLEKNNWQQSLGYLMLDEYMAQMPLGEDELALLYLMFEYPEKFWKICNFYLSLNRARKSGQPLEKLKKLNRQRCKKAVFLEGLGKRYGL